MKKVHLKIDGDWHHFCYVVLSLKEFFDKKTGKVLSDMILQWVKEDFEIDVLTLKDFEAVRLLIRASYKEKYPELWVENKIDAQGWTRLWLSRHMAEEISKHG